MARRLAWLGLGVAALVVALRKLGDFDLPWHLSLGRALIGGAPLTDTLSYPSRGRPAPDELLADLLLYGLARIGPWALQLAGGLIVAVLAWLLARRARHPLLGPFAAALALMAAGPWLIVRPALFSFALTAAALLVIDRHRESARGLWLLVPLQLAWANLHGFAVVGAALAGGYALYVAACRAARGRMATWLPQVEGRDALRVALIAAAAIVVTSWSAYGWAIFTGPFRVRSHAALITEWAPTTLGFVLTHDPVFALLALAAVIALFFGASLFDVGLVIGALVLAILRVRLIPLFAMIAAPLCARQLAPFLEGKRGIQLLVVIGALAVAPALAESPGTRLGLGWDAENLPIGAANFAAAHRPAGALYNFLPFGGWLGWRLPDVPVFIDGRTAWVHAPELVEEAMRAERDPAIFARLEERWHFQWAVVRARAGERFGEPIAADRRWTMAYLDDSAAVYVRAGGPNAPLAQEGYQVLRHLTPPMEVLRGGFPAIALAHDAALAVAQDPSSPRAHFFAAAAALAQNDQAAARAARDRIAVLDPDYPGLAVLAPLIQ